jgi:hypothetical protein
MSLRVFVASAKKQLKGNAFISCFNFDAVMKYNIKS